VLASPTELRELADVLEARQKTALGGDSTIVIKQPVKQYWERGWTHMTLEIGYSQS
jgi:hypothetical protein